MLHGYGLAFQIHFLPMLYILTEYVRCPIIKKTDTEDKSARTHSLVIIYAITYVKSCI